ncbi:serine/threonine-protein kinase [Desulfitobacterium chlororespirans]|uniref:non-specific serine/threonine protein kinase n=1 Tax=Desulfitobacterium chlororespirans DSM 11544 TaxID=1121395 RepID=A0A1M7SBC2_9FIRM|nr:serine/threonine-protein kinase [Desulfitobacterium chlororespirans]SHN55738.1 serine/threonine protein kinase [Desulfitobacterium chlororespirans DSM 11544]
MVQGHIFKIDEHRIGIEVVKIDKDGYRFPVAMLVKGQNYYGVEATLHKPHGKKVVMETLLNFLLIGPKRYEPLVKHVLQRFTWQELNDSLEILLLDGVIQVTFKNQKPHKTVEWLPKLIQLDPRALECLTDKMPDYNLEFLQLKDAVTNLVDNVKNPIKEYLFQWIEESEIKDQLGTIIADCLSFKKYKSIILTIAYYINLKGKGEKLPLRYLSNQIWRQPKTLSTYKNEILALTGITLEEFDSVLLHDINSDLYASIILILPIEELQKIMVKLCEPEISQDILSFFRIEMNRCIQKIIEVTEDANDEELNVFLQTYYALDKKLAVNNILETQMFNLEDFKRSINTMKKHMLKTEYIKQQYEMIVLDEIGSGSFARVYKVFDPESKKIVACKVLFPRSYFKQVYGNDGDEYLLRFKREVRLLTKELQHKNIVKVEKIQLEGAPFWFTMPLANYSLDKWIKSNHDASQSQRLQIFQQIIAGVKYLHENNKYHRDLAPNNILLYETEDSLEVKIADFGLAKDPKSISFFTGLSKKGYGQEEFTDPEQLENLADSTHLSDIYSLGALLYYLLSAKMPKKRFYIQVVCQRVVMKAMDKRKLRYQTVEEFENDLYGCLEDIMF